MHRALLALVLPLLLSLGGLPACTGSARQARNLKGPGKEVELLSDSARLYWKAVRWGDLERAGAFIEDPQQRVLYKDWLEEDRKTHRLEDARVLQVLLGPEIDPPQEGRLQTATVHVRLSGYEIPAQILEDERVQQDWYRTAYGWFLDWELPEDEDEDESGD